MKIIELRESRNSAPIWVNFEYVQSFSASQGGTEIHISDHRPVCIVKETPTEIMKKILELSR